MSALCYCVELITNQMRWDQYRFVDGQCLAMRKRLQRWLAVWGCGCVGSEGMMMFLLYLWVFWGGAGATLPHSQVEKLINRRWVSENQTKFWKKKWKFVWAWGAGPLSVGYALIHVTKILNSLTLTQQNPNTVQPQHSVRNTLKNKHWFPLITQLKLYLCCWDSD